MSLKFIFLLLIIIKIIFTIEYLDTDCYKEAGSSTDQCKKFTTFVNESDFLIEKDVLYLCCYVEKQIVENNIYTGCLPIKEEIVFGDKKPFKFECLSNFPKIKRFLKILSIINILF